MGDHGVRAPRDDRELRAFTRALLEDIRALERLIERGMIQTRPLHVGAEQEMFLVDPAGRAACIAPEVLAGASDPRLTTELARFNIEANLEPWPLDGRLLERLGEQLADVVTRVGELAGPHGGRVLLAGILPSLQRGDFGAQNMTPEPRYAELDSALRQLRGEDFAVFIRGVDELDVRADSVVLEAANASLQLHLQVAPEHFARVYNLMQLVTAPLLAVAAASPLLLGRRLWDETRVALFERSVDARSRSELDRGHPPRVLFGDGWVRESVTELLRENVMRFRPLLAREAEEDPVGAVEEGRIPSLRALTLHNGTVWRWNRPCYGADAHGAHLRIENRVLPAGPSVRDEVANAALLYGMVLGAHEADLDPSAELPFEEAKRNFIEAGRYGLHARLHWRGGREVAADELVADELLPLARQGLASIGVPTAQIDEHLGVIEARVRQRRTPATWMLHAWGELRRTHTPEGSAHMLTEVLLQRQHRGTPAHLWELPDPATSVGTEPRTVADIMTSDLFTVHAEDVIDLATSMMRWRHLRHVPVEDGQGRPVGLVAHGGLARLDARAEPVAVAEVMSRDPATVTADVALQTAARKLLRAPHGCLLVIDEQGQLTGIVTERDFLRASVELLPAED
jgi:CBS domain-containing protein/gamma-glutamyl:cysteine ligase YbdK (ATP-grasp superfamily)